MSRAGRPDTEADRELKDCLTSANKQSFVMIAGAGSGKTTSLVKALSVLVESIGPDLRRRRQKVACITYTEIAASEIWNDVGRSDIVVVATIHSFFWSLIKTFQSDIRKWVQERVEQRIEELREEAANFGPRVHEKTKERNRTDVERFEEVRGVISAVPSFNYGMGSDYRNGVLGHDDVIKVTNFLLTTRKLFRTVVGQQFPYIFVDESQDTFPAVVDGLKSIRSELGGKFCLGFFGDPMQKIYPTGVGEIPVDDDWRQITKRDNFRSSTPVLQVANAIRREADGLVQVPGLVGEYLDHAGNERGCARVFVLTADERRSERLEQIREWMVASEGDEEWRDSVKVLVIVHRMAAHRMGFSDLYAAMNDKSPEAFKNGFLDGTAWPLRPFMSFAVPLAESVQAGDEFAAMQVLRVGCPRLSKQALKGKDVAAVLKDSWTSSRRLAEFFSVNSTATNRDVLVHLRDSGLFDLEPRVARYLDQAADQSPTSVVEASGDQSVEVASMLAFLQCKARQFWGYCQYLRNESVYSTQQGIKGAEYPRVLVVLDDDEGTHQQFSYDKLFGVKTLSRNDQENIAAGRDNIVERTRRLFYVCCTRAREDLVVAYFSSDAELAREKIAEARIFSEGSVLSLADLEH